MSREDEDIRAFARSYDQRGMTLRDYFAAKALQAFIISGGIGAIREQFCVPDPESAFPILAAGCYRVADAMLSERAK